MTLRSIPDGFFVVVGCLLGFACLSDMQAVAQHPMGRVAAPAPAPAPPIVHAPVYRPPIYQSPIYRAPNYGPIYPPHMAMPPVRSFTSAGFRPPPRPIHPFPPIFPFYIFPVATGPFWTSSWCWWATCNQFWISAFAYNGVTLDQWNPANYALSPPAEPPLYVYGQEAPEIPQLFLKDGTVLNVADYWLVDGQLHFMLVQEEGSKPTEQVIPFEELDLQKSVDVNTHRGFRFMLRNEPFEQYIRDHPEGPPAALSPPE